MRFRASVFVVLRVLRSFSCLDWDGCATVEF